MSSHLSGRARRASGARVPWRAIAVGTIFLAVAACGSGRTLYPGEDPFAAGGAAPREVRLRVQNLNFYDARLAAIGDGGRRTLGTVGGNQNAVFTIPWAFPTGMRVEVDLLAGPRCTTETMVVDPGDEIQLQIPANFDTFTLCR